MKIDLKKENVEIEFDPNKIKIEKIKNNIISLGYCACERKPCICKSSSIKQGIIYGLIPHIGCIAFIIGSIIGSTFLLNIFKPMLMSKYFFYILIGISLTFATISSVIYLRNNGFFSFEGIKRKWKYLTLMYGSTIGINLIFFFLVFPLLTNISSASTSEYIKYPNLKISVDIPCSGHAPLITEELKSIIGIENVKFEFPNYFYVYYDQNKISKSEILSIEIFKTYKATEINSNQNTIKNSLNSETSTCSISSCGCGI